MSRILAARNACARRREAAATHLDRWVAHLEAFLGRAHGSWQLGEDGYSRILQEREVLGDDARALRARGQAEFDRLDAEMTALARDAAGNADYVEVLHEDDQRHPPTEQAMLETYAEWTARAPRLPGRVRPGDAAAGRVLRRRPVAGVPASDPGRRVVHRAAGVLGPLEGPLLRPVRARRRVGGRDPGATVEQLVRVDPHDVGPRGLPGPSLAPRDAQGATRRTCARSTRRPTSARAGRCTRSA